MGLRVCTHTLCIPDGFVSKVVMRKMPESGDSGPLRPNKVLIYFQKLYFTKGLGALVNF